MRRNDDPSPTSASGPGVISFACRLVESAADGVTVRWLGGSARFRSTSAANEFIRREGLHPVASAAFRAAEARIEPCRDELLDPPLGGDTHAVAAARRIARFQAEYRRSPAWPWWCAYCRRNGLGQQLEALHVVRQTRERYPALVVDWLVLLRDAVEHDGRPTNIAEIAGRLHVLARRHHAGGTE